MKILPILIQVISASHFRAGALSYLQGPDGTLEVVRAQAWRHAKAGYGPDGCSREDVVNQKSVNVQGLKDMCYLKSGGRCHSLPARYIVTDIEKDQSSDQNFCYGYQKDAMQKPPGPFYIEIRACCWVDFKNDFDVVIGNRGPGKEKNELQLKAIINDVNNNTPQLKLPPVWRIMVGCPAQTLELNPNDADGDEVICRWATQDEAHAGHHNMSMFGSITLDQKTCILTYDGTKDMATTGVKPIAIMIEDHDVEGNVLSAIPVQFLAMLWNPQEMEAQDENDSPSGLVGRSSKGHIFKYPTSFLADDEDDHDSIIDHEDHIRKRRSDLPSYCARKPKLIDPSPAAGTTIIVNGVIKIKLKARTPNGSITRFQYNSPMGMKCNKVIRGETMCVWKPTADQSGLFNFCFSADDSAGMTTERRCIALKTEVTDIFSMINHFLGLVEGNAFRNYGCAGVGNMKANEKTAGFPIDLVDKAINTWKHCVRCAESELKNHVQKYDFDEEQNFCENPVGSIERSVCECDMEFATTVDAPEIDFQGYNTEACVPFPTEHARLLKSGGCCKALNGMYTWYNAEIRDCCATGEVREIGEC